VAKLFIGPMSKNIVDVVIEKCNNSDDIIGLIPSRRQIEHDGGYVNNWTTAEFVDYVRNRTDKVIIERDHAGPAQGKTMDDGKQSLIADAKACFDLIHIDPWKEYTNIEDGINATAELIKACNRVNSNCLYEIGTEQAIRKYSHREFEKILFDLKKILGPAFAQIKYAVIQGGTRIEGNRNIGEYDEERCSKMIETCKNFGVLSKEHNGDYLSPEEIKNRFDLGLDAINIAPEFGAIETQCVIEEILNHFDEKSFQKLYSLCYESDKWKKWLPAKALFSVNEIRKYAIIRTSGHYVFANPEFQEIKGKYPNIDSKIKRKINQRIEEILCTIR
tara:strand:- start:17454 stop:18449 length:996 start_codon:yes stop_codon:yes gene_type:complete